MGIIGDFTDELGEQAQEFGRTAVKQITGKSSKIVQPVQKPKASKETPAAASDLVKEMYPQPVAPEKMTQLQQEEAAKKAAALGQTRAAITNEKIQRYASLQQRILVEEKKREGEIPEYEAGKPGAARTQKEKIENAAAKQEEEQKKMEPVSTPTSTSHQPGLDAITKQTQGTRETKWGKIG